MRKALPSGNYQRVQSVSNNNFGDMCSMVLEPAANKWMYHSESRWGRSEPMAKCTASITLTVGPQRACGSRRHGTTWTDAACPSGSTGRRSLRCNNGQTVVASNTCRRSCGTRSHGATWTTPCGTGQTGVIHHVCNNGSTTSPRRTCLDSYQCPSVRVSF